MIVEKRNIVLEKAFALAIEIVKYSSELNNKNKVLSNQVLRSGTSIGANINEAQASLTKKEFIAKFSIAAKEARETKYWLNLITESNLAQKNVILETLVDEVIKLVTSIIKTSQQNEKHN